MGQPVVAHRAVKALDISVLLRLARLHEVDKNAALGGLSKPHSADVLRAVIAANDLGFGDENRRLKKMYAEERLKTEIAEPLTKNGSAISAA